MSKFYAVKKGRIPGVYTSWTACKTQINGFSGALHKSFANELDALNFVYGDNVPVHLWSKAVAPLLAKTKTVNIGQVPIQLGPPSDQLFDMIRDPNQIEETEPFYYGCVKLPMVEKSSDYEKYDRSILDTSPHSIMIYIDGSKRPSVNHRGSGAYCRFDHQDYFLSCPFTPVIGHRYQINPEHFAQLSSPTMEFLGLTEVLWRFLKFRFPLCFDPVTSQPRVKILNPRTRITFVSDYDGVKNFTEGNWTAREDYIIKIKNAAVSIINFLKERGIDVVIHHVNGHKGMLGNELSDIRAKSQVAVDTIDKLVIAISEKVATEN